MCRVDLNSAPIYYWPSQLSDYEFPINDLIDGGGGGPIRLKDISRTLLMPNKETDIGLQ